MLILILTGRNATPAVRKISKSLPVPSEVRTCAVDVAAFISREAALAAIRPQDAKSASLIIVPGLVQWDVSYITEKTGVPACKGPMNVSDLPEVMEKYFTGKIKLSAKVPADALLEKRTQSMAEKQLKKAYGKPDNYLFSIGKKNPVYIGSGLGRVVAEINDAPSLSLDELAERAGYLKGSGAGIIDIGMQPGTDNSENIADMVSCIRTAAKVPVSIDSTDAKEIISAADAKIDLVMSIDHANLSVLDSLDVPAVVIPRDAKGRVPHKPLERIKLVEEIITNAPGKKLIADMILSPLNSGYADSLKAYSLFRERNHLVPMLLGAGNVTELLDADSVGVNALLAGYASETGIELLFTVEASPKTRGSVRELSRAAEMFYLAKKRGQPPKDLGLDLLRLKDKRKRSVEDLSSLILPEVAARKTENRPLEDAGFRIYLDDRINAIYYYRGKPTLKITGSSAKEVYDAILDRPLTKDPFHAAYLGKELCKAEIALRLGKEYVQDRDLF